MRVQLKGNKLKQKIGRSIENLKGLTDSLNDLKKTFKKKLKTSPKKK